MPMHTLATNPRQSLRQALVKCLAAASVSNICSSRDGDHDRAAVMAAPAAVGPFPRLAALHLLSSNARSAVSASCDMTVSTPAARLLASSLPTNAAVRSIGCGLANDGAAFCRRASSGAASGLAGEAELVAVASVPPVKPAGAAGAAADGEESMTFQFVPSETNVAFCPAVMLKDETPVMLPGSMISLPVSASTVATALPPLVIVSFSFVESATGGSTSALVVPAQETTDEVMYVVALVSTSCGIGERAQ